MVFVTSALNYLLNEAQTGPDNPRHTNDKVKVSTKKVNLAVSYKYQISILPGLTGLLTFILALSINKKFWLD